MTLDKIGKIVYSTMQALDPDYVDPPPWEDVSDHTKNATLEIITRYNEDPSYRAELYHEQWKTDWENAGWTFGKTRNDAKKKHPFLVNYNELPESLRVTNTVTESLILSLLPYLQ